MRKEKFRVLLPYLFLIPTFAGIIVFGFYPFVKTVISSFSFTDQYGEWLKWAGTYFWKRMVSYESGLFWKMLGTSLLFAGMNFVFTFTAGMALALLCVRKTKMGRLYQTIYALPIAISSVAASVMWGFIFKGNGGLMNTWLGIDTDWLADQNTALLVVSIITSWCHVGTSFLLLLAGFRGVPMDVQEAATLDGATGITRAFKILIPMASPQIFFVVFTNILTAIKTFTQIRMLTYGGPLNSTRTLMYEIYYRGIELGEYESACCISIVVFLIIFVITRIQFALEKKLVHYQ